jgi:hypothetical protein
VRSSFVRILTGMSEFTITTISEEAYTQAEGYGF